MFIVSQYMFVNACINKYLQKALHGSPVRASYGMSFVSS